MSDDQLDPSAVRAEGVRSVTRAVGLLRLFDVHHPTRSLRELVAETGLPKTTVVRLLATLESTGLVAEREEVTYGLGAGFLRWVRLAASVWEVDTATRAAMRALVDECGETVNIYVRQESHRLSIAQEEGTTTVRSVIEVGTPMPLTAGATAKVLLTGVPTDDLATVLPELAEADLDALRRQVAGVHETGYAVTHGERELGASAVAAPIRGSDGRVVAALSISGPTSRFTADRVVRYVDAVVRYAAEISGAGMGSVEGLL